MKKIALFISTLLLIGLTGCGNQSLGFGNYNFNKVHCVQEHKCIEITTWYDNDSGIEVDTENGAFFFSEGTYILIENDCPYCEEN